jgi:predicted permease
MDTLWQDIRSAVRLLWRHPAFGAAAVLTLTLAIGATTAVFSLVEAVLLRALPFERPGALVRVTGDLTGRESPDVGLSVAELFDWRDRAGVFESVSGLYPINANLTGGDRPERIEGLLVDTNYFAMLGVQAQRGRVFTASDYRAGIAEVAVISDGLWRRLFGADPHVVGKTMRLDNDLYTILGVAPAGFRHPGRGIVREPEVWCPSGWVGSPFRPGAPRFARNLQGALARVRPELTVAQAQAKLAAMGVALTREFPNDYPAAAGWAPRVVPLHEDLVGSSRQILWLLMASAALVMSIACANVASLLLARAVTRRREVAVRVAMGAGRGQLVRQWLTEAVILGLLGGAAGLVVAMVSTPLLHRFAIPEAIDLSLNLRVLAFTLATGVATGLLFGLAPVLQLIGRDTLTALRDEGGGVATGIRATRVRSAFVVLQVALSLVLLVGAGLFLRTVQEAYAVELGYRIDHMLIADVDLGSRYTPEQSQTFHGELLERVNALPGVVAAGAARVTVLSGVTRTMPVSVDGQPIRRDGGNVIPARANVVSDRYLEAMGIALVRGRGFQASDGRTSAPVAIVSRSLANRLWPNVDPIGQRLVSLTPATVVGVVADTVYRSTVERDPRPVFYLSLAQSDEAAVSLHVRTAGDPLATLPAIRQAVRDLDPRVAVTRPRRLADELDRSVTEQRAMATFVGVLSGIALLLAAVGLYGVMAHAARQRTAEIGLRLALGATPASIVSLVVARGARLVSLGAALGVVAAFLGVRFVRNRLFGVEPTDPLTWIAVSAALISIALVACVIPARRAMRVNPTVALRG